MDIGTRKLKILSIIIEDYIRTGEPVGSKRVCAELQNSVSSATVRNDMSSLSDMGLIDKPHTSAGRTPTQMGYRIYVDRLMPKNGLEPSRQLSLDSIINEFPREPVNFLTRSCKLLSDLTGLMTVITTPGDKSAKIRQIELIPMGSRTVLFVLMTSVGIMHNRLCKLDLDITGNTLSVFKSALNGQLSGRYLTDITPAFIQTAAVALENLTFVISPLLLTALKVANEAMEVKVIIGGQENLIAMPDMDFFQVKSLFSLVSAEEKLKRLLSSAESSVKFFVGKESGCTELEFLSMAAGRYKIDSRGSGAIGVIGPLRMDYSKIYSEVEYFASSIGRFLSRNIDD